MEIMMRLHIMYYLGMLAYILSLPYTAMESFFLKLTLFIFINGSFILLCTFYIVLSFNKKIMAIKKYYNLNIAFLCFGLVVLLYFGPNIYKITNNVVLLIVIFFLLFIVSNFLNLKIRNITENLQFNFMQEVKLFMKVGQAIERTPLMNAMTKLDYLLIAFAVNVAIAESFSIFAGVIGVILLLSTKYLKVIRTEFLNSGLISKKETYLSLFSYYFSYLAAIIWSIYITNLSVLLIGSLSVLAFKIYMRRIAEKVYAEKNPHFSKKQL